MSFGRANFRPSLYGAGSAKVDTNSAAMDDEPILSDDEENLVEPIASSSIFLAQKSESFGSPTNMHEAVASLSPQEEIEETQTQGIQEKPEDEEANSQESVVVMSQEQLTQEIFGDDDSSDDEEIAAAYINANANENAASTTSNDANAMDIDNSENKDENENDDDDDDAVNTSVVLKSAGLELDSDSDDGMNEVLETKAQKRTVEVESAKKGKLNKTRARTYSSDSDDDMMDGFSPQKPATASASASDAINEGNATSPTKLLSVMQGNDINDDFSEDDTGVVRDDANEYDDYDISSDKKSKKSKKNGNISSKKGSKEAEEQMPVKTEVEKEIEAVEAINRGPSEAEIERETITNR